MCQPALSIQIIWMNLALNATTDLYLMSIPVPMLWKSGLKLSRKIASTILLTSGVFIVVCALLRSILITIVSGPFVSCHPFNGFGTASFVTCLPLRLIRLILLLLLLLGTPDFNLESSVSLGRIQSTGRRLRASGACGSRSWRR